MPVTDSGDAIILTGADTSLSVLLASSFVILESGAQDIYKIIGKRLVLDNANLTYNSGLERLAFDQGSISGNVGLLDLTGTSTLTANCTLNGVQRNDIVALDFGRIVAGGLNGVALIHVDEDAEAIFNGGHIIFNAAGNLRFMEPAGILRTNGTQIINQVDVPGSCQINGSPSAQMFFDGTLFRGVNFNIRSTSYISQLDNCTFEDSPDALVANASQETIVSAANLAARRMSSGNVARFLGNGLTIGVFDDPADGNDISVQHQVGASGNDKYVLIYQNVRIEIQDENGNSLNDAVVYAQDVDNGSRQPNITVDGQFFEIFPTFTYSGTGASHTFRVLTQVRRARNTDPTNTPVWPIVDNRGTANGATFPWKIAQYNKTAVIDSIQLEGNGEKVFTFRLLPDFTTTEQDGAAVRAYLTQETRQRVYDQQKAQITDFQGLEAVPPVSLTDGFLNTQASDVNFLSGAALSAFAGNTLTAYADPFLDSLIGTGNLSLQSIAENQTIRNYASVQIASLPTTLTLDNTILDLTPGADITSFTELNGASYRATADGTYIARGKSPTIVDANGFSISVVTEPLPTTYTLQLPNIINGSRFQIYNVTQDRELTNSTVSGGGGISQAYTSGVDFNAGDTGRYRVTYQSGTTAKRFLEGSFTFPSDNATNNLPVLQEDVTIHSDHGVDGSTVDGITWDSGNLQFDFNDADNVVNGPDIAAWYYYFITTSVGIHEVAGAIEWTQVNRFQVKASIAPITFDNIAANPLQINNCWIDRDDGISIIAANSNSIQINPPAVFAIETGTSGLTASESALLSGAATQASVDALPTLAEMEASTELGGSGTSLTQSQFNSFMADVPDATKDTYKADVSGITLDVAAIADAVWSEETRTVTGGQIDTMAGTLQTLDDLERADGPASQSHDLLKGVARRSF